MTLKNLLFTDLFERIPPRIRRIVSTFVILILLFIVYSLTFASVASEYEHYRLHKHIPLSTTIYVIAFLIGVIYFIIATFTRKSGKNSFIHSIQVFLVFAAIPYVIFLMPGWGIHFFGPVARVPFSLICILPEVCAFIGLVFISKHYKKAGSILIAIAVMLTIEVFPLRGMFLYDADFELPVPSDPDNMIPFGKEDREFEFKRSLKIIEDLSTKSVRALSVNLQNIVIYLPNLDEYPNILKIDTLDDPILRAQWLDMNWPDIGSAFRRKEYLLDVQLDSDGDGLSDFQEAEILSDAYNADTDGDGIKDGEDTDPLNQLIESNIGDVKSALLQYLRMHPDLSTSFLIDNEFYHGRGEFSNIDKHVILLSADQINKWNVIFGEQYLYADGIQRSYFGQRLIFGKCIMDLCGRVAAIGVIQKHGVWVDSSGFVFLLAKFSGKWHLVAGRLLWI